MHCFCIVCTLNPFLVPHEANPFLRDFGEEQCRRNYTTITAPATRSEAARAGFCQVSQPSMQGPVRRKRVNPKRIIRFAARVHTTADGWYNNI